MLESLLKDGLDLQFNLKFLRVEHEAPKEEGDFPLIKIFVEQDGQEKVSKDLRRTVRTGEFVEQDSQEKVVNLRRRGRPGVGQ